MITFVITVFGPLIIRLLYLAIRGVLESSRADKIAFFMIMAFAFGLPGWLYVCLKFFP